MLTVFFYSHGRERKYAAKAARVRRASREDDSSLLNFTLFLTFSDYYDSLILASDYRDSL